MNLKLLLFALLMIMVSAVYSQSKFSIEVTTGYDKNFSLYDDLYGDNYSSLPDFNAGLSVAYYLGNRFRLRTEFKYVNNSYTRRYNSSALPVENIKLSTIAINSININPRIDYRLASLNKFDFYISTGIRFEIALSDYQRSERYNGEIVEQRFIADTHKSTISGGIGGFNIKYNITPKFALSLAPEFTYFFDTFYDKNDNNFQRSSLNVGAEWRF